MSHQSGIGISKGLHDTFADANRDSSLRIILAAIENTEIVVTDTKPAQSDWESDLDLVPSLLRADRANYVLFRTDSAGWYLFAYVPDNAPVKDKMLYASSRATLKRELGSMNITQDIFGTKPDDFSRAGYAAWKELQDAEAPLSREEFVREEEKAQGEIYRGGASMHVHGVAFPADDDVYSALQALVKDSKNYAHLGLDIKGERITLAASKSLGGLAAVADEVPRDAPSFHFFRYKHTTRDERYDETLFVYVCPEGAPIKERMLYSSSKGAISALFEAQGGTVAKSFEFTDPADLRDVAYIDEALHPAPVEQLKSHTRDRPRAAGKGARRLLSPRQKKRDITADD